MNVWWARYRRRRRRLIDSCLWTRIAMYAKGAIFSTHCALFGCVSVDKLVQTNRNGSLFSGRFASALFCSVVSILCYPACLPASIKRDSYIVSHILWNDSTLRDETHWALNQFDVMHYVLQGRRPRKPLTDIFSLSFELLTRTDAYHTITEKLMNYGGKSSWSTDFPWMSGKHVE